MHLHDRQRKKHGGINIIYGGGEDFPDKFAPPLVLFMAQEQLQQLHQHTQQLEIADAPSWKHFEYVLESNSGINTMLETALRCVLLLLGCIPACVLVQTIRARPSRAVDVQVMYLQLMTVLQVM